MMNRKFVLRKLKQLGRKFDFELINAADPSEIFFSLMQYRQSGGVQDLAREFLSYVLRNFGRSQAQLFQDLFVLFWLNEKRGGYFVEFGATNGVTLSNSYLLEKEFGWSGILAEPAQCWHGELKANRGCKIDTRCVWSKTGDRLEFNEVSDRELSTINVFSGDDSHSVARQNGRVYFVETVSLTDLLGEHEAPRVIDYLSVDTEGSELTVLGSFDFSRYDVRFISVEHNFTPQREKIHDLLVRNRFRRVLEGFSRWDDWYVKE